MWRARWGRWGGGPVVAACALTLVVGVSVFPAATAGGSVSDDDIFNVFERVLAGAVPAAAVIERCREAGLGRPLLAGSGPAFFFLLPEGEETPSFREGFLLDADLELFYAGTLDSRASTTWREEV